MPSGCTVATATLTIPRAATAASAMRQHDHDQDECVLGKQSGECVLDGSLVGVSPLREDLDGLGLDEEAPRFRDEVLDADEVWD